MICLILLSACGNQEIAGNAIPSQSGMDEVSGQEEVRDTETENDIGESGNAGDGVVMDIPQTGMTQSVPDSYKMAAGRQGSVERLDYDSLDYARDSEPIEKTAYVYLPYGYDATDAETKYDIIYLMHGWGGHAGEYFEFTSTKNMFDNLIENGDIPPVIIVSAIFYNGNSRTDFGGSINEFREFH